MATPSVIAATTPKENATPPQRNGDRYCGGLPSATQNDRVALSKTPQLNAHALCGGVAVGIDNGR
jgi:hypothetical protein